MPCCLLLFAVRAGPRIVLVCMFLFSNYLERAYHGLILPILGFILLPVTTIAYAWLMNTHRPIEGVNLVILIVAVVVDLGGIGGGAMRKQQQ
jgi:hypothetical protein